MPIYVHHTKMQQLQSIIVRSDNVRLQDDLRSPKVFYASSGKELMTAVREYYLLTATSSTMRLELWSQQLGTNPRIRLDDLDELPAYIDQAWIRAGLVYTGS